MVAPRRRIGKRQIRFRRHLKPAVAPAGFVFPAGQCDLDRVVFDLENPESIEKRLRIAESECLRSGEFNYIICNDSVENASGKIMDIIKEKLA